MFAINTDWIYKVRYSHNDKFIFTVGENGFFAVLEKK